MSRCGLVLAVVVLAGCRGEGRPRQAAADPAAAEPSDDGAAVPVIIAAAERKDLPVVVSGPGRTESVENLEVRAPFDGVLLDLLVSDGDHVKRGRVLGWFVSRDSEAAMVGAREMLRSARTPEEHRNAERALTLSERGLVKTALRAPESGAVLSHQADEGARLSANQPVVTIVPVDAIVFVSQVAQVDLSAVRAGQPAVIALAGDPASRQGTVHAVLPGGSATDLTAPVRIDFARDRLPGEINLFGVAHITVGVHAGALVVPKAAVIRDDVTGVSRVAVVDQTSTDTGFR